MAIRSGKLTVAIGAARSGKSQYVKSQIPGKDRVLVWDIKGEYPAQYRAYTQGQLSVLLKQLSGKPGIVAFTAGGKDDFTFFCQNAQNWVKSHYVVEKNCVLIFEETSDVTSPGKAPDEYGIILRRYLSLGVDIFAVTQRPAESDKTAVGNASIVHVCRLQLARDRKSAAGDTGLPLAEVERLRADQDKLEFDFINVDTGRGFWRTGVLKIVRKKAVFSYSKTEKPL